MLAREERAGVVCVVLLPELPAQHINSWYFALSYDRTSATELANTMDFGNAPERNHRIFFTSRGTTPFPPEESSGTLINSFMHIILC